MRHRTVLLVAVLVLGTVGGPAADLASGADVALEIVVETDDGDPVDDATVTASWDGGSESAETSSNGRVFIDVPEGENVTIEIDHEDYIRNRPYEITDAAADEVTVTVWEKAAASITIVDSNGPVEDARVAFRKGGNTIGVHRTDVQGTVESGIIEAGEYSLRLSKTGYLREIVSLEVQNETNEEFSIERASVTVTFTVLDDHFDPPRPVSDATIDGSDFNAVTQPGGQRSVSVPVNSEQSITVQKDGYQSVDDTISVDEEDIAVNITTRRSAAVNLQVSNERIVLGETVQVAVTDEYGDPIDDATVFLDDTSVGEVDDAGTFRVPIESSGDHAISASAGDLSSDEVLVTGVVAEGDGPTATPTPDPGTPTAGDDAIGDLLGINPRSTALGLAGGLVLAVVLFLVVRFR